MTVIRVLAIVALLSTTAVPGSGPTPETVARPTVHTDSPLKVILNVSPSYTLAPIPLRGTK